jgi:hypothetical protein
MSEVVTTANNPAAGDKDFMLYFSRPDRNLTVKISALTLIYWLAQY